MTTQRAGPLITVRTSHDGVYLETGDGQPLYYYAPARHDPDHDKIPYGSTWPLGIRAWILCWPPLLGDPQPGQGVTAEELAQHDRRGDQDYPGFQVTFRGWPLYTCTLVTGNGSQAVLGLWLRAHIDLTQLGTLQQDAGGFGPPRSMGGP